MKTLIALLVALILTPILLGVVVMKYWEWFLLPIFDNLPLIGLGQAYCISLFVNIFKVDLQKRKTKTSDVWELIIVYPLILLLGWIIYLIIY